MRDLKIRMHYFFLIFLFFVVVVVVNKLLNTSTLVLFIRIQLDSVLLLLQSKIAQEKKDFNKKPGKVREIFLSSEFLLLRPWANVERLERH